MRVLFDQAIPVPLRDFFQGHDVRTATQEGWDRLQNGAPLTEAEDAGFDVFLTTDKNMQYQQNLAHRDVAIVVLLKQQWPDIRAHVEVIAAAIDAATRGSYVEVDIP